MNFIHETTDYNVAEFYERFQNDLPKTVMVNQGFFGEILEDTFDREQVLRIHAISRQPRVTAKLQYGHHSRLISIPMSYEEKLCVVKHGNKHGKPKPISNIVRQNTLPITVQFPKDHEITVGNHTMSTNNIPSMELMQTFEEVYLLANLITDGEMSMEVTNVPLYLSQLRLAVITCRKGQSMEEWSAYQQQLDQIAAQIEFDHEFGNPNIAEYDPSAIHSDTTYEYIEPTAYSNIISLVHKFTGSNHHNTTPPHPPKPVAPTKPTKGEAAGSLTPVRHPDDIAKLTIDEVVEYMKMLKLERYADEFKNQLIDGSMLKALDKDILKEEFGMRGIEALRLIKFIQEGHIPI